MERLCFEEAIFFSRHQLESIMNKLHSPLAETSQASPSNSPLPRKLKRIEAIEYISEYRKEEGYNPVLLELATLDFNILQRIHLRELKIISE
ncbi:hypothetical protein PR202_ga03677 [Eleusine coracana subsp. coracana]|uniref:Uncharacterized protein n=1 Tax=Eleusine coracana subsp. coracana TaxID=191504 RepID=A0AAV5BR11_ELECO|nr:hypothetical protein PR202_ga03677 [Eleusine coracana subsp. coracana]